MKPQTYQAFSRPARFIPCPCDGCQNYDVALVSGRPATYEDLTAVSPQTEQTMETVFDCDSLPAGFCLTVWGQLIEWRGMAWYATDSDGILVIDDRGDLLVSSTDIQTTHTRKETDRQ